MDLLNSNIINISILAFFFFITIKVLLRVSRFKKSYADALNKHKDDLTQKIKEEKDKIPEAFAPANTWQGFKYFKIINKNVESWTKNHQGQIVSDICSFTFAPAETPTPLPEFQSGQHLSFIVEPGVAQKVLKKKQRDGKSEADVLEEANLTKWWDAFKTEKTMYYSLSDGPNPNTFRCSIKRALPSPRAPKDAPPGIGSTYFHEIVEEGDVIKAAVPKGDFYLDHDKDSAVVLVAGGIGITPMVSMGVDLISKRPDRETFLYYGVRHIGDIVLVEDILTMSQQLKSFTAYICLSDPTTMLNLYKDKENTISIYAETIEKINADPNIHLVTSFDIDENIIFDIHAPKGCRVSVNIMKLHLDPKYKEYDFYLCGPPPMMKSVVTDLYHWHIPKDRVHWEGFGPCAVMWPGDILNSPLKPCTVTFLDSEKDEKVFIDWTPANGSLMNLADDRSESLKKIPRSCGAGFCGTCKTNFKGRVTYENEPGYKDLQENQCLPCICKPHGDVIVEY